MFTLFMIIFKKKLADWENQTNSVVIDETKFNSARDELNKMGELIDKGA